MASLVSPFTLNGYLLVKLNNKEKKLIKYKISHNKQRIYEDLIILFLLRRN